MIHGVQRAEAARVLGAGRYLHWGVVQISLTNLLIIAVMVAVFVAALVVRFPGGRREDEEQEQSDVPQ